MRLLLLSLLAIVAVAPVALAADWAVLVAGSNTFSNYRHQADVAHAYQLISGNGIPADQIITMLYDDVATNSRNPFPGQVFNAPTAAGVAGVDVWANVQKDYTGKDVTPENFLAILTGNATAVPAGKKVLKSGPKDNVFVFFSDHGGVGLLAFPDKYLYATDLIPALKQMHASRMYERLVFYIEACEAGSMFAKVLPTDIDIYAVTASDPTESSWGTFCPPNDSVNGKHVGSCLGDLFAVNWMVNSEDAGGMESLQTQYDIVRNLTDKSHVMQYGDVSWTAQPIGDFIGHKGKFAQAVAAAAEAQTSDAGTVSSRDVPVHLAYYRYIRAEPFSAEQTDALADLRAELDARESAQQRFVALSQLFARNAEGLLVHTPAHYFRQPSVEALGSSLCVKAAVDALRAGDCDYDDHSLQYHRVIVNACGQHLQHEAEGAKFIVQQIEKVCTPFFKYEM